MHEMCAKTFFKGKCMCAPSFLVCAHLMTCVRVHTSTAYREHCSQAEVLYMNFLLILSLLWAPCCDVIMMSSMIWMSRVFWEHQLLHCQTVEYNTRCGRPQRKGVSHMWTKADRYFLGTSFMTTHISWTILNWSDFCYAANKLFY